MKRPKRLALRDAFHTFKSPYWEDRLYSKKKETIKDQLRKLKDIGKESQRRRTNGEIPLYHNPLLMDLSNSQLNQAALNSNVAAMNAHSMAAIGCPIM